MTDLASLLTPGNIVHNTNNNEEKDETVSAACGSYSYQSWAFSSDFPLEKTYSSKNQHAHIGL